MKNFLCNIGIHKYETIKTIPCKVHCGTRSYAYKTEGTAVLQKCIYCGVMHAYATEGTVKQTIDVDYMLANI